MRMQGKKSLTVFTVALTIFTLFFSTLVLAAPTTLSSKQKKAEELKKELDEFDEKLSVAAEKYNEACYFLNKTKSEIKTNENSLTEATEDLAKYRGILNLRVKGIYKYGEINFIEVLCDTKSFEDFTTQLYIIFRIGKSDAELIETVAEKKAKIEDCKKELETQKAKQEKFAAQLKANKSSIEKEVGKRDTLYNQIKGEIAHLERAEASRRAQLIGSVRGGGVAVSRAPGAPNGSVVDIAMRYLGCPYRWGAAGPNAFDCSGLVMYVYAQVGISLPHSSRAQYSCGARVSRDQLRPGDLVFFGRPIHHVGIYVGGGNFIHAPHRGAVVSISSLSSRRNYAGACRP